MSDNKPIHLNEIPEELLDVVLDFDQVIDNSTRMVTELDIDQYDSDTQVGTFYDGEFAVAPQGPSLTVLNHFQTDGTYLAYVVDLESETPFTVEHLAGPDAYGYEGDMH